MTGSSNAWKRWGTAIGTVIVMVVGVLGAPPASAAPAAPGGLSPQTSSAAGNPVLKWNRVAGGSTYQVEVSASSSFATVLYKATTANRQVVPTAQLPAGTVWWRVRAVNSSSQAGPWTTAPLGRSQVAGPSLLSPAAEAELVQPTNPPLLSWVPISGATSYEVEIDAAEGDFIGSTVYSTRTTSLVVPNPQENGTYWWRVRALQGSGLSTKWSSARNYTVGPLPTVDEAQPFNSPGTQVEDVVFDWEPVPGAISYDVRVSTDDSFNEIIDTQVVKGTRYSEMVTYNNDQYWWQVRARNIFGKAQEWDEVPIRSFQRHWPEAPKIVHPTLTEVDDTTISVGDDLYYQWTPVPKATRYRLQSGTDPSFTDTQRFEDCFTTQTSYAPGFVKSPVVDKCMPRIGATTYWRVQALDGKSSPEVNGVFSKTSKFIYNPGSVSQTSPLQDATVDVPTLRWAPHQDAVKYDVQVSYTGGSKSATTFSTSWTPTGETPLDPTKGPFTWTVRAVDLDGNKTMLPVFAYRSFDLTGEMPSSTAAPLTPLTPAAGAAASQRFPELTWAPVEGAAYYKVHVGDADTGIFAALSKTFPYPAATDETDTYLRTGHYDWFVSAYDRSDNRLLTTTEPPLGSFSIARANAPTGHKIALDGSGLAGQASSCASTLPTICGQTRATPMLDWDPVPNAGYYMVYLSKDKSFTNLVFGNKADPATIPKTQNTRWTPTVALPESQAGDAYYWYIRTCKTDGACSAEPTDATLAFDKRSNEVERLSPLDDPNGTAPLKNDITFTWKDYLVTNKQLARANPATGEQAGQAARGYRLQVGTTSAFSTIVDEVEVDQTTYTAFNKTYPEGKLYWRVQAVDGSGNRLAWSDPWTFTKASGKPQLMSPLGGTSVNGTQPLRWKPTDFAARYDLEIYKNGDTTASSGNRVLVDDSQQVAYSPTKPLPVSNEPYVWRVRREDADRRKGAWSDWGSFVVTGSAPELVSPSSSQYVSSRDSLFTWKAVTGATSYRFERRLAGSTSNSETVSTVALAWAPTKLLTDGTWQWRVTAYDPSGAAMKSSAWRTFYVDLTRPRVVKRYPVRTTSRTANFVAKFSEPVRYVSGTSMKLFVKGLQHPLTAKVTVSSDRRTATLNPAKNLRAGKVYVLKLGTGIRDGAGNRLAATSWSAKAK